MVYPWEKKFNLLGFMINTKKLFVKIKFGTSRVKETICSKTYLTIKGFFFLIYFLFFEFGLCLVFYFIFNKYCLKSTFVVLWFYCDLFVLLLPYLHNLNNQTWV